MNSDKESQEKPKTQVGFYQGDLFGVIFGEVQLKAVNRFSERNLFSLTNKPRKEPIQHIIKDGNNTIAVTVRNDTESGLATVHDYDLMLFLTSLIVKEKDATGFISSRPMFSPSDYFHFKGIKKPGGKDHRNLYDSLKRLQHTFVEIVRDGATSQRAISWNWISYLDVVTNESKTRIHKYKVEIPQAIVDAVANKKFLTLDKSYFAITSPLVRFLYLFARKAVGRKNHWKESISSLHAKTATKDSIKKFKWNLKRLAGKQLGSDPWVYTIEVQGDDIIFRGRNSVRDSNKQRLAQTLKTLTVTNSLQTALSQSHQHKPHPPVSETRTSSDSHKSPSVQGTQGDASGAHTPHSSQGSSD